MVTTADDWIVGRKKDMMSVRASTSSLARWKRCGARVCPFQRDGRERVDGGMGTGLHRVRGDGISVDGRVEELDARCPESVVGWTVPSRAARLAPGRVLKATS
jgi:hypothetical protein